MNNVFCSSAMVILLAWPSFSLSQELSPRMVAFTIDDLPVASTVPLTRAGYRGLSERLVSGLTELEIPAYGFVVESKLVNQGRDNLNLWLDAGFGLGNHTFSHPSLNAVGPERFTADILAGEKETRALLAARDQKLRYFRFPMLQRGNSLQAKNAVADFLESNGYTIAPVSIDNQEWVFAGAYDKALARQDSEMMERIGDAYVDYMETVFEFFEENSLALLGYEPKQILLIHANALNADYIDELAAMLKARNYSFISLEEAMKDPFYALSETYTGGRGLSWLHRVTYSQGKKLGSEPRDPKWLSEIYSD